jgi:hypothetical protein
VTDDSRPWRLKVTVLPLRVRQGDRIQVTVDAVNVGETTVKLEAPDTVIVSQPHTVSIGSGIFQQEVSWIVLHVQAGTRGAIDISVSDGRLTQGGLCQIDG